MKKCDSRQGDLCAKQTVGTGKGPVDDDSVVSDHDVLSTERSVRIRRPQPFEALLNALRTGPRIGSTVRVANVVWSKQGITQAQVSLSQ